MNLIITLLLLHSGICLSQDSQLTLTERRPVESYDVVCNFWQLKDPQENTGAPIAGFNQRYIFITGDHFVANMMTPNEINGLKTECQTFFNAEWDPSNIYFTILGNPCSKDLTEEELIIKIPFRLTQKNTRLELIIDGKIYEYEYYSNLH